MWPTSSHWTDEFGPDYDLYDHEERYLLMNHDTLYSGRPDLDQPKTEDKPFADQLRTLADILDLLPELTDVKLLDLALGKISEHRHQLMPPPAHF